MLSAIPFKTSCSGDPEVDRKWHHPFISSPRMATNSKKIPFLLIAILRRNIMEHSRTFWSSLWCSLFRQNIRNKESHLRWKSSLEMNFNKLRVLEEFPLVFNRITLSFEFEIAWRDGKSFKSYASWVGSWKCLIMFFVEIIGPFGII